MKKRVENSVHMVFLLQYLAVKNKKNAHIYGMDILGDNS